MRGRPWSWLGLAVVLAFDVWLRAHVVGPTLRDRFGLDVYPVTGRDSQPLDCDEAIYAYIGKRVNQGAVMYRDLTENKPPGGYWLYAGAVAIGGADELTVRLAPIPPVLATLAMVWWLAGKLGGPLAAVAAGLTYAVLSTDPFLYADGAQMETMLNLFATGLLVLLVSSWERPGRSRLVAAGACLGAACLVKQVAVVHLPVMAVALLSRRKTGAEPRTVAARAGDVAALAFGTVLVAGLAALAVTVQGAGPEAFDDVFRYGRALATDTPAPPNAPSKWVRWVTGNADPSGALPWPFGRSTYLVWWGTGTWPVWLAAVPALARLAAGPAASAGRRLVAAWTISAWVQVALPGLFWPHYYQLPIPGLSVAVALLLADLLAGARARGPRRLVHAAGAVAVGAALFGTGRILNAEYLRVPPEELVRDKGGRQWVAQRALGRELARRAPVWRRPTLFVWGWQGTLYFYSGYENACRQVFVDDLMKHFAGTDHPLIRPRVERIMRDLKARPPSLIYAAYPPFPALRAFLRERYLPSRLDPGLWVERGRFGEFETFEAAPH